MKRIVDGLTYNTDTATKRAKVEWSDNDEEHVGILYQTRGGAFFVHDQTTKPVWNQREEQHEQRVTDSFEPMSPEEAHKWMLEGDVEVFDNAFEDPPEAASEGEAGATLYLRVPASLKRRVDGAAKFENLSGNSWMMRCLERCLDGSEAKQLSLTQASQRQR